MCRSKLFKEGFIATYTILQKINGTFQNMCTAKINFAIRDLNANNLAF